MLSQDTALPRLPDPPALQRIGRIVAVTGAHAIVLLDVEEDFRRSEAVKSPEIGTLLKVDTTSSVSMAMVSALSSPMPSNTHSDQELRIAEVEFIGELPKDENGRAKEFRRGISFYPALGDAVFRASQEELAKAYACDTESAVRIGHIQQDPSIPAMIKVDEMLGKHFAVLGTTGTGKSCSVALILRRILEKNPQAHILLLDIHREYTQSFKDWAEVISPDNMNLPFWLLNFDESVEILIGNQPHREPDIEILRELIPLAKTRYMTNQRKDRTNVLRSKDQIETTNIGVDTPIPYRTSDLIGLLEDSIGKLDLRGELAPYKRLKARIETISRDPRYGFMFGGLTVHDTMAQVLSRIFRVPVNGKPIAILELSGLPSEIINVVVSVLARLAFDFGVWSGGRIPITFVCEEAHRYVPIDKSLGFEPTKRAISRIAKEGRKYGVSLCIVTQRPAELDPTILSQCNTIFSLRLTNERDQEILKAGISDAAASLLEFMTTMGTGEAITFGEGVALPTRIKFDMLPADAWPKSNSASFTQNWAKDIPEASFLHEVVNRWRQQTFNPASAEYAIENVAQSESAPSPPEAPLPAVLPSPQPAPLSSAPSLLRRPPSPSAWPSAPAPGSSAGLSPQQRPAQPAGQPMRGQLPPLHPSVQPAADPDQQTLASLIRQFRS